MAKLGMSGGMVPRRPCKKSTLQVVGPVADRFLQISYRFSEKGLGAAAYRGILIALLP